MSPSARWRFFRPKPGMPGYWTPQINLLHGSPAMGTRAHRLRRTDTNFAIGWKGNYRIEGRAFTQTESRVASLRSLAIPPPKLHNWAKLEKLVPSLPSKTQIPRLPPEQSPKSFCRLTAAARNERSAVERKIPLPSQRGAKPDQERNEINGNSIVRVDRREAS